MNGDNRTYVTVEIGLNHLAFGQYHSLLILTDSEGQKTVLEGHASKFKSGVISSAFGSTSSGSVSGLVSGGSASGSSGYGFGRLIKDPTTDPLKVSNRFLVPTPTDQTVDGFAQSLLNAYNSYGDDKNYSPLPGGTEANSNSLIGSALRISGSDYRPPVSVPGWDQNAL
jgi:hypothetical protein